MRIHFRYEALDSREQRVARLLGRLSQTFTMASFGGHPDLAPTICTYRAYFFRPEKDPFSGNYEAVLDPYRIDLMNAAAALTPVRLLQQVYAASQQGDPTAFLLWHATPRLAEDRDPGRVSLLHSVSNYTRRMVTPPCQWDVGNFANRGDMSYGTAPLANWDPTYLHLSPDVYVPSAAAIDTSLSGDANLTLLGPYGVVDAGAEIIRCCKTVYIPAPYVGLLLGTNLTLIEACNCLRGDIVKATAEDAYRPLIEWICAAIVRAGPDT